MIIVDLPGGTRRSVTNVSCGGFEFNANAKKARTRNATLKKKGLRDFLYFWFTGWAMFGCSPRTHICKVEKILKGSLDLISSPSSSMKI